MEQLSPWLRATSTIETQHPLVLDFVSHQVVGSESPREQAVKLFYAVRDGIRYDPYLIELSVKGLKASTTLQLRRGWCVSKAILLAACCRAIGIPARLGYADVRNHLSTARMRAIMKTDVFYWHGYTSLLLEGQWLKATPAFNIELCRKFRLRPLEFDGRHDSLYHPFDLDGRQHMEYIHQHGEFDDVPIETIRATFLEKYVGSPPEGPETTFDQDVEQETTNQ